VEERFGVARAITKAEKQLNSITAFLEEKSMFSFVILEVGS
jgi:hypothetical protein